MKEVRKVKKDEWMDVYLLVRDFYEEGHWAVEGEFSPENTMRYISEAVEGGHGFGVWVDGKLAGVLTLEICYEFDTRPRAYVTDLFVNEIYRGMGLGRDLVEIAIKEARSKNAISIYAANTGTFTRRANALHDNLFKKYGFAAVSTNLRMVL